MDIIDDIVADLDPKLIPSEFISSVAIIGNDGKERFIPNHEIPRFKNDPNSFLADSTGEVRAVFDATAIKKAIRDEIEYVTTEVDRLFQAGVADPAKAVQPAKQPVTVPDAPYLNRKEAAAMIGISSDYLGRLNARGEGPLPRRLRATAGKGSPVRYRRADVDAYIASSGQVRCSETAPATSTAPTKRPGRPPSYLKKR